MGTGYDSLSSLLLVVNSLSILTYELTFFIIQFDKVSALAKGFLTRLLIQTERIQAIIQTIKVCYSINANGCMI